MSLCWNTRRISTVLAPNIILFPNRSLTNSLYSSFIVHSQFKCGREVNFVLLSCAWIVITGLCQKGELTMDSTFSDETYHVSGTAAGNNFSKLDFTLFKMSSRAIFTPVTGPYTPDTRICPCYFHLSEASHATSESYAYLGEFIPICHPYCCHDLNSHILELYFCFPRLPFLLNSFCFGKIPELSESSPSAGKSSGLWWPNANALIWCIMLISGSRFKDCACKSCSSTCSIVDLCLTSGVKKEGW